MSTDSVKPFEKLDATQQSVAIDLAVACSVIVTRLPSVGQAVFAAIEHEFATQYDVSTGIAKYALRACGRTLFETAWTCTVTKDSENIIATHFKPEPESPPGGNGE